jgi:hypothetical protein
MLFRPDSKISIHNPYTKVPVGTTDLTRDPLGTEQAIVCVLTPRPPKTRKIKEILEVIGVHSKLKLTTIVVVVEVIWPY